jgi:tetratricopeptide (TPR) repeat protein
MAVWFFWLALFSPQTQPQAPDLSACAALLEKGLPQDAANTCKKVVGANPRSGAAHLLLGQAYLALRSVSMLAEGKAELQQALDLDPELVWGRFYLAKVYLDTGRPDKAKYELEEALRARPGTSHFLSLLGEAERKLGHPELAIGWHQQALAADPNMNTVHYYSALAYMDLQRDADAVRELEASLRSPYLAPEMLLTLGSLYAKQKRYREAEELCRKAIAIDPGRSEGYLDLAQLFNAQRLADKALDALRKAMPPGKTFPTSPYYQTLQADIHFEFGRAWMVKRANREAIAAFLECLALDSARTEAHRQLAELYRLQGDAARAADHAAAIR